ncbi:MAG: SDR family oxidoreductase [Magnetococcales bacterium]|nr:SDR family oxidoreductase [Magnetococcales bacterium]MBF0149508.1 SDR family oxidoreductase [Magnetococcales bacterium]MBF0630830.1 SDR family oxidoreductase [Magnetococcales bacterium]
MTSALLLGATKGLGLELAREGARRNLSPIIYGRSASEPNAITEIPPQAVLYPIDLHSAERVQHAPLPTTPVAFFFWVAGAFHKGPLQQTEPSEIDLHTDLHFRGPVQFLRRFLRHQAEPFHLVTIGSVSSWRLREDEALYCGLKAAQTAFTRNFAVELVRDRPGSQVTLINPGGLNIPTFWEKWESTAPDLGGFLDPGQVARIIWDLTLTQTEPFRETQLMRRKPHGSGVDPIIEHHPRCPEVLGNLNQGKTP